MMQLHQEHTMTSTSATARQQPMSLMTISAGQGGQRRQWSRKGGEEGDNEDADDLLTLRILEASERKMQLIRELLTPEEYNSLSSDLFTSPREIVKAAYRIDRLDTGEGTSTRNDNSALSAAATMAKFLATRDDDEASKSVPNWLNADQSIEVNRSRRFISKSEMSLNKLIGGHSTGAGNIQDNLTKKRQAIEFFFNDQDQERRAAAAAAASAVVGAPGASQSLAIELRFGHYMARDPDAEDRLLTNFERRSSQVISYLVSLLVALLALCYSLRCSKSETDNSTAGGRFDGRSGDTQDDHGDEDDEAVRIRDEFIRRHKMRNKSPYTSKRNLLLMRDRLRADQQLDKIMSSTGPTEPVHEEPTNRTGQIQWLISRERIEPALIPRQPRVLPDEDSALLIHAHLVERWTRHKLSRPLPLLTSASSQEHYQDEPKDKLDRVGLKLCYDQELVCELSLQSIALIGHQQGLISREETLATNVICLHNEHAKLMQKFHSLSKGLEMFVETNNLASPLIGRDNASGEQFGSEAEASAIGAAEERRLLENLSTFLKLLKLSDSFRGKLSLIQAQLEGSWDQLTEARRDQQFNSTRIVLSELSVAEVSAQDPPLPVGLIASHQLDRVYRAFTRSFGSANESSAQTGNGGPVSSNRQERLRKRLINAMQVHRRILEENSSSARGGLKEFELNLTGQEITPDSQLPSQEFERRAKLNSWLQSLHLRLKVSSSPDCHPEDSRFNYCDEIKLAGATRGDALPQPEVVQLATLFQLNRTASFKVAHSGGSLRVVKLDFDLVSRRVLPLGRIFGRFSRWLERIEATGQLVIDQKERDRANKTSFSLDLKAVKTISNATPDQMTASNDEPLARLELELKRPIGVGTETGSSPRQIRDSIIDQLHDKFFVCKQPICAASQFETSSTKLAKLVSQIDVGLLMSFLGHGNPLRATPYCVLDPFVSQFDSQVSSAGQSPLRSALLAWRWITRGADSLQAPRVHLSERENAQLIAASSSSSTLQGMSSKPLTGKQQELKSADEQSIGAGYKSIELTRSTAIELIRQFELLVTQLLELNRQNQLDSTRAKSNKVAKRLAADLLVEPRLKVNVNLVGLARTLRLFVVPHWSARRPLMPDRARRQRLLRRRHEHATKLGQLVELSQQQHQVAMGASESLSPSGAPVIGGDIEHNALDQWRDFASGAAERRQQLQTASGEHLRLLVTIRQAHNVPLRIESRPMVGAHLYPSQQARPTSPFYSSSPTGQTGRQGQLSSPLPAFNQQQQYLAPPTSYVEVIFQRKQLASSLAQGKNPAWNETLFFSVDKPKAPTGGGGGVGGVPFLAGSSGASQFGHLADEYLQLNLYDCRCYVQGAGNDTLAPSSHRPVSPSNFSTMPIGAGGGGGDLSIFGQSFLDLSSSGQLSSRLFAAQRQRVERHLIGSLRIPLAILLTSGRIEGSFALNQPLLLDNYQFEADTTLQQSIASSDTLKSRTNLNLFVTLDPPISIALHVQLPLASHEQPAVFAYARFWEQVMLSNWRRPTGAGSRRQLELSRKANLAQQQLQLDPRRLGQLTDAPGSTNNRHVRALVLGDDACYRLVSRYLAPLKPPIALIQSETGNQELTADRSRTDNANSTAATAAAADQAEAAEVLVMKRLARFVSLLSPLKYGQFQMRALASNVWFDSMQLVEKSLGGPEEKAILLCNYFLYLGHCSALLLGDSIPDGRCVYVIVWSDQFKRPRRPANNSKRQLRDELFELSATLSSTGNQTTSETNLLGNSSNNNNRTTNNMDSDDDQLVRVPVDQWNFIASLPILVSGKTVQLWEPNMGTCYQLNDPTLPLISVGSIVTCEDVYANVQVSETPTEIYYDIRQKNHWWPLFGSHTADTLTTRDRPQQAGSLDATLRKDFKRIAQSNWRRQLNYLENLSKQLSRPTLRPVIPTSVLLNYQSFTYDKCQELKVAIEQAIKAHLLTWRPDRPTYFNRTLSRLLASKLATFERTYFNAAVVPSDQVNGGQPQELQAGANGQASDDRRHLDWRTELADLIREEVLSVATGHHLMLAATGGGGPISPLASSERQVISWPVNLTFTSMRAILDGLYASGVHSADLVLDSLANGLDQQQQLAPGLSSTQQQQQAPGTSTQFLVACHVHPYPARLMSVWLYVGALVTNATTNSLLTTQVLI